MRWLSTWASWSLISRGGGSAVCAATAREERTRAEVKERQARMARFLECNFSSRSASRERLIYLGPSAIQMAGCPRIWQWLENQRSHRLALVRCGFREENCFRQ